MSNKKITTLFILIATFLLIGIVGFTIAYFTSSTDFENEFQTGLYETTATEVFESPENWMPGDTTPKTLTITNTGSVDVKARVCITKDEWESSNGTILPSEINGDRISIINLDNTDEWTKKGNCYEYNEVLEPNDTTSSFIQSVTFNPDVVMPEADVTCTTTINNNQTTKVCSSSGEGLSGATYTLKLTVETIQANVTPDSWREVTKYAFNSGDIFLGGPISNEVTLYNSLDDVIDNEEHLFSLKYTLYNNIIIDASIPFRISDEIAQSNSGLTAGNYILIGGVDESTLTNKPLYEANKAQLLAAFGSSNCTIRDTSIECNAIYSPGISANATTTGKVAVGDESDWYCGIDDDKRCHCDM